MWGSSVFLGVSHATFPRGRGPSVCQIVWDLLHGTVCLPILEHQIRPSAPSSVISRPTCFSSSLRCSWQVGSAPLVRRRCDCLASSAPFTNIQTYLLTYMRPHRETTSKFCTVIKLDASKNFARSTTNADARSVCGSYNLLVKHCLSIRQCKSSGSHVYLNPPACSLVSGLCFRSVHMSVRIISRK